MYKILIIICMLAVFPACPGQDKVGKDITKNVCELCPEMVVIAPDTFEMGEWKDRGYGRVEGPRHTVVFENPFEVAVHEVSIQEFERFVTDTGHVSEELCNIYTDTESWHIEPARNWRQPGFLQDANHPVVCVNWEDTQAYIAWLNAKTGQTYRLMSEAEWEYLAKFGGIDKDGLVTHDAANIGQEECCGGKISGRDAWQFTSPVGSFPADSFGVFDIRGNVWEWQADCYHDSYAGAPSDGKARSACDNTVERVVRGGGYGDAAEYTHPEFRLPGKLQQGYFTVGFRLARDAD